MAELHVERVGDTVTVEQDGVLLLLMPRDTALQLGAGLYKVGAFGADTLDEEIPT